MSMPTQTECVRCQEITATANNTITSESSTIQCITDHEGFDAVCLNVWVLQTSYYTYRQHYGAHDVRDEPEHECECLCIRTVPLIQFYIMNAIVKCTQAVQIYGLSAIYRLVLGVAGKKNESHIAQLCSQ